MVGTDLDLALQTLLQREKLIAIFAIYILSTDISSVCFTLGL
jgi:hypothetical protein